MRAEELADYYETWASSYDEGRQPTYRTALPDTDRYPAVKRGGRVNGEEVEHGPYLVAETFKTGDRFWRGVDVDPSVYGAGLVLRLFQGDGKCIRMGEVHDFQMHACLDIPAEWVLPFIDALVRMRPKLEELFGAIP